MAGMHAGDRRQQHAGKPCKSDAERRDRRHVRRERDAERADHVGVLHTRPHHASERRAVDDKPGRRDRRNGDAEDDQAIARIDEIADEDLAAQLRRNGERQWRGAEDDAQTLLDHHRQPEGQEQAQDRIGAIEAAKQQALDRDPDHADDDRRDDERAGKTDARCEDDREIGADGVRTRHARD